MANVTATISDKELDKLFTKLYLLKRIFSNEDFSKIIGEAAKPAEDAMKKQAPKSKKPHKIKDEGGGTKMVKPGTLRNSIQTFQAKKQKSSTAIVGAILSSKAKVKSVKGIKRISRRKNAYYASIVNSGGKRGFEKSGFVNVPPNRFIERARTSSKSAVVSKLKEGAIKYARTEVKDIFK